MAEKVSINIKLDEQKDADLVEFLEDKPNTFIIKEALKMYMRNYLSMDKPSIVENTVSDNVKAKLGKLGQ